MKIHLLGSFKWSNFPSWDVVWFKTSRDDCKKTNIAMEKAPIFPGKYYQNGGSSSQAILVDPQSVPSLKFTKDLKIDGVEDVLLGGPIFTGYVSWSWSVTLVATEKDLKFDHLLERQDDGKMAFPGLFLVGYMPSLYRKVSGNASFAHFKLRFAWASDGWKKIYLPYQIGDWTLINPMVERIFQDPTWTSKTKPYDLGGTTKQFGCQLVVC